MDRRPARPAVIASRPAVWKGLRLALLLLAAAVRLSVALADHRALIGADVWQDDAFYYLKIAANVAAGRGPTFDGAAATNGFQPLHLALVLPIVAVTGADRTAPIHAVALLLSGMAVAVGAVVFALARRLAGTGAGLLALALFSVSPYFATHGVNGQETGLAMLFAAALPLLYLCWIADPGRGALRRSLLLGAACGLAVLARLDLALLAGALAADGAVRLLRGALPRERVREAAIAALAAAAVCIPWWAASRSLTGSALPASGPASRLIAQNVGWSLSGLDRAWSRPSEPAYFDPDDPPPAWYADVATRLGGVFLLENPLLGPLRLNQPFHPLSGLRRCAPFRAFLLLPTAAKAAAVLLFAAAFILVPPLLRRRTAPAAGPGQPHLDLAVLLYLAATAVGYTFFAPMHWYFGRYLAPAVLLSTIWGIYLARAALARLRSARRRTGAAWLGATALIAAQVFLAAGWLMIVSSPAPTAGFLTSWERLGPHVASGDVLGSFQAGTIAWFSGRDVVNLDGKVNPAAHEALRRKGLHRYVRERGVTKVMDWEWIF